MTLRSIIEKVDAFYGNCIPDSEKLRWLSELDMKIYDDIILRHKGYEAYMLKNEKGEWKHRLLPYTSDAAQLIAPERFSEMYEAFLEQKIDFALGEMSRYTDDLLRFHTHFEAFWAWYNETHLPLQKPAVHTCAAFKRGGV